MCYSATTSFAAGSVLTAAGVYCLGVTARRDARYLALAALPVVFGAQQFAEGAVWRELEAGAGSPSSWSVAAFLFLALAFWPVWIPFSMAWIAHRRAWLVILGALGAWIAWSLYSPVFLDPGRFLKVSVVHHSIRYDFSDIPVLRVVPEMLMRALYVVTIIVPLLLGDRRIQWFGLAVLASMVLSQIVFAHAFTSVWCLFAAILSAYLALYARSIPRRLVTATSPSDSRDTPAGPRPAEG